MCVHVVVCTSIRNVAQILSNQHQHVGGGGAVIQISFIHPVSLIKAVPTLPPRRAAYYGLRICSLGSSHLQETPTVEHTDRHAHGRVVSFVLHSSQFFTAFFFLHRPRGLQVRRTDCSQKTPSRAPTTMRGALVWRSTVACLPMVAGEWPRWPSFKHVEPADLRSKSHKCSCYTAFWCFTWNQTLCVCVCCFMLPLITGMAVVYVRTGITWISSRRRWLSLISEYGWFGLSAELFARTLSLNCNVCAASIGTFLAPSSSLCRSWLLCTCWPTWLISPPSALRRWSTPRP